MRKISEQKKTRKATKAKRKTVKSFVERHADVLKNTPDYIDEVETVSTEEVYKSIYPKTVIPVGEHKGLEIACDSQCNIVASECEYNGPIPLGWRQVPPPQLPMTGIVGKILKHFSARNFFLGDQVNGWFRQNCFIYKACSMPGDDAVACGYEIVPRGAKDKALIQHMSDKFNSESFNLDETMREFDCNKRGYGGAFMVPCFEEDVDMSVPLNDYSQFKGKHFIGWTNIEPYYLSPEFESNGRELSDPTYKFYLTPTYWNVYGSQGGSSDGGSFIKRIHRDWLFFRRNILTAKIYQPMYKYLGPSIPQMIIERLYSAEVCANESSMLLRSKRTFVIEADVRKMAANPEYASRFLKNCEANANNYGTRIVPRGSKAQQMDSYLSECMPLTTAQYGILCAEVEIPAPKFMMAQLTGFANSGNYETKLYAQNIRKLTKSELAPIIKQTVRFETACLTGVPLEVDIRFGDVDVPTITEQAEILYEQARATKFSAEANAINKGEQPVNNHKSTAEREDVDS